MDWTEIKISVPVSEIETASSIAVMAVPYGIYVEDYSCLEQEAMEIAHIDLIDEELLGKDRDKAIIHLYISPEENPNEALSFLSERLDCEGIAYSIDSSVCCDDDWANGWKKFFKPMYIGERLFVCPAWIEPTDKEDRAVLLIEPGAAFGSGTHETTRLCLEMLDRCIKNGDTVLDIGCGSGILSVAALLLGAKEALGVDIDELAVKTARENGKMNGFTEPEYTIACGNLTDNVNKKYRVIVANIVADVIMSFSDDAFSLLEDDGVFITSGIIDSRADEVICALDKSGFKIADRFDDRGWVCLVCEKQ